MVDNKFNLNIPWGTVFASIIWLLWKVRNNHQFNNVNLNHMQVATGILKFAEDIHNAFVNTIEISAINNDMIK